MFKIEREEIEIKEAVLLSTAAMDISNRTSYQQPEPAAHGVAGTATNPVSRIKSVHKVVLNSYQG